MKKLELKHLAPYLPYGLKMAHFDSQFKNGFEAHTLNGLSENYRYREEDLDEDDDKELLIIKEITFWFNRSGLNSTAHNVKPILRPLSDLMNTIIIENKEVTPYLWWDDEKRQQDLFLCSKNYEYVEYLEYFIVELLLEWHFDIFGLIEKGLAIDLNTLNQEL